MFEIFTKYWLNASAMCSSLVNEILFSVTVEGTEFDVYFRDITFLIPFQVSFKSLIFVSISFVKYDCLLPFSKVTEIDFCMLDVIQGLLSNFSLSLEAFFTGAYLSIIKLILI